MEIYTEKAQHIGRVEDVILNLENGEIMRLSLRSFKGGALPADEVKRVLQSESIGYNEVKEVGDIIIIEKAPAPAKRRIEQPTT